MNKGPENAAGFLVCDVDRNVRRRILIDFEQLAEIEKLFREMQEINTSSSDHALNEVLNLRFPRFEVNLTDGSSYKVKTIEELKQIRTSALRQISKITISVWGDLIKANVRMGDRFSNPATISVEGAEDKAEHYANKLHRVILERSDFTVFAARVSPILIGFLVGALVFFSVAILVDEFIQPSKDKIGTIATVVFMVCVASVLPLSFYIDTLRDRWIPPASFLWGYGERHHETAKRWIRGMFLSFPVWIIGLFLPSLWGS